MKIAFLFPGQGAQKVGMGLDLFESSTAAKAVFIQADRALEEPLSKLIFEGPADDLTLTANTQPAILTMSMAALAAFGEKCSLEPVFVAGHSLGEFSALVAAGALDFQDAVRVTRARGTYMQEAVSPGKGAMAAVMGKLTQDEISKVCDDASSGEVVAPANFNAPGQVVISGHADAVKRASDILSEKGAKVIPLKVSAPFHSALMEPAARKLEERLAGIKFAKPKVEIVTNVEAKPNGDQSRIRELLVAQVTAPVRWTDTMQFMLESGVEVFMEFGPGNVLAGLLRRFEHNSTIISINSTESIDKGLEVLKKLQIL